MSYKRALCKKLEDYWREYEWDIERNDKLLCNIYYDGFTNNCVEHLKETEACYDSYQVKGKYIYVLVEKEEGAKLFLLPKEYELISTIELIKPLMPPDWPVLKKEPSLRLPLDEYPDWYKKEFIEREVAQRLKLIEKKKKIKERIEKKIKEFNKLYLTLKYECKDFKDQLILSNSKINARLIEIAHYKHSLPKFLKNKFHASIDSDNRIALIEFKFPDYSNENLVVGYIGKYQRKAKYASEKVKKKLVKQCLYSLIIRAASLAAKYRQHNMYDIVVVNVEQGWFDPATGQPRTGLIASLQAPVEYLESLNLSKLDPEVCFKHLKGILTPSLQNISPIRPIFVLNKNDNRIVSSKDVDSELELESNLASLPWEDFEHLVAQLFEWEFARKGIEVKVTRASRDRGVDAILYDPDPLKGGKYVLQAKRYTRTVDVSAVRDLYGTVMNEGANRGILITTSSYGPDAYEFVKNKPISLVDGQNLLIMLQKHGKKYRINLEEARRLNNEL